MPSRFTLFLRRLRFIRRSRTQPIPPSKLSWQYSLLRNHHPAPRSLAQRLPCELLQHIFSYLTCTKSPHHPNNSSHTGDPSSLRALTLVCSTWRYAILSTLFATIHVSHTKTKSGLPANVWHHARNLHISLSDVNNTQAAEQLVSQLNATSKAPRSTITKLSAITISDCEDAVVVSKDIARAIAAAAPHPRSVTYITRTDQRTTSLRPKVIDDIVACLADPRSLTSISGMIPGMWAQSLVCLDLSRIKLADIGDAQRVSSHHQTLQSLTIGSITPKAFIWLTFTRDGKVVEFTQLRSLTILAFASARKRISPKHLPSNSSAVAFPAVEHLVLGKGQYSIVSTTYLPTQIPEIKSANVTSVLAHCGASLQSLQIEYADEKPVTTAILRLLAIQRGKLSRVKIMYVSPMAQFVNSDTPSSRRLAAGLFALPHLQSLECLQPLDCTDIVPSLASRCLTCLRLPGSHVSLQQLLDLLKAQQFLDALCVQIASLPLEHVLPDGMIHQRIKSLSLSWNDDCMDIKVKGIHRRLQTLQNADFPISYYLQFM